MMNILLMWDVEVQKMLGNILTVRFCAMIWYVEKMRCAYTKRNLIDASVITARTLLVRIVPIKFNCYKFSRLIDRNLLYNKFPVQGHKITCRFYSSSDCD